MDPMVKMAAERGIPDRGGRRAVDPGSGYQGRRAGSIGEIDAVSAFSRKAQNLGAYGDGRASVTTNDAALAPSGWRRCGVHGSKRNTTTNGLV